MTRHTHILATVALLAAMPLAATAAEPATDSKPGTGLSTPSQTEEPSLFKELDRNHNGKISRGEAKKSADVKARFSELDTNNDKQISLAEWQAGEQSRGAAGVSGESREQQHMKKGQSAPGKTGETPKSNPDPSKSGY